MFTLTFTWQPRSANLHYYVNTFKVYLMNLTVQKVKLLVKNGTKTKIADGNGLYLRVTEIASGFWIFKYTRLGKRPEVTIGKFPDVSLADARDKVLYYRRQLAKHIDPQTELARATQSPFQLFDDLAEDWLKDARKRLLHPSIPNRIYKKEIKKVIGNFKITDVTALDVKLIIEKINDSGRPAIANDALGYLKQIFRHGMKLGVIDRNPADAFRPSDAGGVEHSRDRVLSQKEIVSLFGHIKNNIGRFGYENYLCVKLLLLLGVRKSELIQAPWDEINLVNKVWNLPALRSKTNSSFTIPLTEYTVQILNELKVFSRGSDYVFPSRRLSKRALHISSDTLNRALSMLLSLDDVDIKHFTVHDLRRTFRSLLSELKVQPHISERCLNHKLKGIEQVYDRYDYFDERKIALETLCEKIKQLEL